MKQTVTKSRTISPKPETADRVRSVLIALDLTAISDRVLSRSALLPLAERAHLTVLHVVRKDLPIDAQESALRDARRMLASEVRNLRLSLPRGSTVEANAVVGSAPREIGLAASACQAELIVMGRGGGRALRDSFLGSTAERVIRASRLPVLAVRLPARAAYRRPALALEFDDAAAGAVAMAQRLLVPDSARVTVIHAIDTPYRGVVYPSIRRDEAEPFNSELELRAARKMAKVFAQAAMPLPSPNQSNQPPHKSLRWKPHVRSGSARMVIAKAIQRTKTDLLIMGTAGRRGVAHWLLGSVAGDVLREAACDVLLVPPQPVKPTRPR